MSSNEWQKVRELVITDEVDGQRIDNFLLTRLKGVPKTRIYRILRKGEVRVNKGRIKPSFRLHTGDVVRIPPIRMEEGEAPARPPDRVLEQLERSILYEEKGFLVLNKPSGLAVHGGSGLSFGIIEAMRHLRPDARFLELVHRLDRDTSGCLVIAKRRSTLREFHELLRSGAIEKRYRSLVMGRWKGGGTRVDAPLRKNTLRSGERIVQVAADGKPSQTIFRPLRRFKMATLMDVTLLTGRTHQVRVHAAHSGHPVAGDEKYGDAAFNRQMADLGLRRLFLHAAELSFQLSEGGTIRVEAPMDENLLNLLDTLAGDELQQ